MCVCVCVCAYCVAGSGKLFGGWEAGIKVCGGGCVEWDMVGEGVWELNFGVTGTRE